MQFFEESIKEKISSFWQNFRAEIILISISLIIVVVSLAIFIKADNQSGEEQISFEENLNDQNNNCRDGACPVSTGKIYIDFSGAVEKPDVYEVSSGARLKDVLILGNGLSAEADRQFFARNFNLARILKDQEKIYIPSVREVQQGLFRENVFLVSQIQPRADQQTMSTDLAKSKININTASAEELDTLPGIGPVTSQKIISNRPYSSIEELLTKKAVNKSVYEKIKNLVAVN